MDIKFMLWIGAGCVLLVLAVMVWARTAARPTNLGVQDGRMALCPDTPNCVATQSENARHKMAPISYTTSVEEAQARLLGVVQAMPQSQVDVNDPGYVSVSFRSRFFGFIDDSEFWFDEKNKQIHFRSAARQGRSDFGVNRKRMAAIAQALSEPAVGAEVEKVD